MNSNPITLNWQGPIKLEAFHRNAEPPDDRIGAPGVYMHTLPQGDKYIVIYVGKADLSTWERNCKHHDDCANGKYALVDIQLFKKSGDVNIVFVPEYDQHPDTALLAGQLKAIEVLYANVPQEIEGNLRGLEGALQLHLWRTMTTRKYLLTSVSSYSLRGTVIDNLFPYIVAGFEGEKRRIYTPQSK